jgi:predicted ATP-grasp superfamily ATP-dependent carboligase
MRIFVFEYVTGGGLAGGPMLTELVPEGDLMLRSLVDDLTAIPGLHVEISRDQRLPAAGLTVPIHWVCSREALFATLQRCIADADAVWPIAPETDGVLDQVSDAVLDAGRLLLNSYPRAVANGLEGDRGQCAELGRAVAAAIPGLSGFVGVDMIVDRQGPVILEVNPRLTSCYPGLSRSLGANVAEMLLGSVLGTALGSPRLDCRPVEIDLEQCHVA